MTDKTKICTKCKIQKPIAEFCKDKRNKDGLQSQCKKCNNENGKQWCENNKEKIVVKKKQYYENNKEKITIHNRQYRENNKEKIAIKKKQYRENNKEKIIVAAKQYYKKNKEKVMVAKKQWYENNKEKEAARQKQYRENNKEKVAVRMKQWCKNNPEKVAEAKRRYYQSPAGRLSRKKVKEKNLSTPKGRLNQRMSIAINRSLRAKGSSKNGRHWETLVGYKIIKLKQHLEKQFVDGMDWSNYGKWHIDHKKPIVSFNYDSMGHPDFKKCWDLKNLQPLWAKENSSKGAKLNWEKAN